MLDALVELHINPEVTDYYLCVCVCVAYPVRTYGTVY